VQIGVCPLLYTYNSFWQITFSGEFFPIICTDLKSASILRILDTLISKKLKQKFLGSLSAP
jgi:hypothetical protein